MGRRFAQVVRGDQVTCPGQVGWARLEGFLLGHFCGISGHVNKVRLSLLITLVVCSAERPAHAGLWDWWCRGQVAKRGAKAAPVTFEGLSGSAKDELGLKLVSALQADRFYEGNPFSYLSDYQPLAAILERGVSGFKRTIYRTSVNVGAWNSGYDVVLYRVKHADKSMSVVLGAKRMSSPFDVMFMGGPDMRKVHQSVYVAQADGSFGVYEFEGGMLKDSSVTSHPLVEAVDQFVEESIANRGFYLLSRPDELIIDRR